jgi:hypothetical protein
MASMESSKPVVSTAQRVMKICLIVSIALGCVTIVLGGFSERGFLNVCASVIPCVAIQWFFYLMVKAKQQSKQGTS